MFLNINTLTLAASDYVNIRGSLRRIKRSSLTVSTDSLPIFSHIYVIVTPLDSGRDAQHLLYFMNDPCILQQKLIDKLVTGLNIGHDAYSLFHYLILITTLTKNGNSNLNKTAIFNFIIVPFPYEAVQGWFALPTFPLQVSLFFASAC